MAAVDKVAELAKPEFKARMAVKLAVAGAFHTDFMKPAVPALEAVLKEVRGAYTHRRMCMCMCMCTIILKEVGHTCTAHVGACTHTPAYAMHAAPSNQHRARPNT